MVSRVARALDAAVAAFRKRLLSDRYRFLVLDGVVLKHRTGRAPVRRPMRPGFGAAYAAGGAAGDRFSVLGGSLIGASPLARVRAFVFVLARKERS